MESYTDAGQMAGFPRQDQDRQHHQEPEHQPQQPQQPHRDEPQEQQPGQPPITEVERLKRDLFGKFHNRVDNVDDKTRVIAAEIKKVFDTDLSTRGELKTAKSCLLGAADDLARLNRGVFEDMHKFNRNLNKVESRIRLIDQRQLEENRDAIAERQQAGDVRELRNDIAGVRERVDTNDELRADLAEWKRRAEAAEEEANRLRELKDEYLREVERMGGVNDRLEVERDGLTRELERLRANAKSAISTPPNSTNSNREQRAKDRSASPQSNQQRPARPRTPVPDRNRLPENEQRHPANEQRPPANEHRPSANEQQPPVRLPTPTPSRDNPPENMSQLMDNLCFWDAGDPERRRKPANQLSRAVQDALKPSLEKLCGAAKWRYVMGKTDTAACCQRRVCRDPLVVEPAMATCTHCRRRNFACVIIDNLAKPTIVPVPAANRQGLTKDDVGYWLKVS